MDPEAQVNELRKKYENSEKNLATLKKLAHKGKGWLGWGMQNEGRKEKKPFSGGLFVLRSTIMVCFRHKI